MGKHTVPALNWNQASDRFQPHKTLVSSIIPTNGNSTKRTKTACRPGAMNPGGSGVDVKHNSYDRYLARKKGYLLSKPAVEVDPPMMGNKCRTYNIINECVKCVDPPCSTPEAPCAEVKLPCNPCGDCCPCPDTEFRENEPEVFCGKKKHGVITIGQKIYLFIPVTNLSAKIHRLKRHLLTILFSPKNTSNFLVQATMVRENMSYLIL